MLRMVYAKVLAKPIQRYDGAYAVLGINIELTAFT